MVFREHNGPIKRALNISYWKWASYCSLVGNVSLHLNVTGLISDLFVVCGIDHNIFVTLSSETGAVESVSRLQQLSHLRPHQPQIRRSVWSHLISHTLTCSLYNASVCLCRRAHPFSERSDSQEQREGSLPELPSGCGRLHQERVSQQHRGPVPSHPRHHRSVCTWLHVD